MATPAATIAYYTVIHSDQTGWTGGLLSLTRGGRPIEFQCTLPVRPSRAHQILFGATLRDHLLSEVIGPTLLKKMRTRIDLLVCDQPESLQLVQRIDVPVALVVEAAEADEGPIDDDALDGWTPIPLAGGTLRVPPEREERCQELAIDFRDLPDLVEPFDRIRSAIREAHGGVANRRAA